MVWKLFQNRLPTKQKTEDNLAKRGAFRKTWTYVFVGVGLLKAVHIYFSNVLDSQQFGWSYCIWMWYNTEVNGGIILIHWISICSQKHICKDCLDKEIKKRKCIWTEGNGVVERKLCRPVMNEEWGFPHERQWVKLDLYKLKREE
jgi:hypothetical protein